MQKGYMNVIMSSTSGKEYVSQKINEMLVTQSSCHPHIAKKSQGVSPAVKGLKQKTVARNVCF